MILPQNDVEVITVNYLSKDKPFSGQVHKVTRNGKIYLYGMDNKPIDFDGAMGEELIK